MFVLFVLMIISSWKTRGGFFFSNLENLSLFRELELVCNFYKYVVIVKLTKVNPERNTTTLKYS